MDWCLEPGDPEAARSLRHALAGYLRRHAEPGADIDAAELAFSEILANAVEHAGGPVWVSVDWAREMPVLTVHDLGPGFDLGGDLTPDPFAEGGRGLFIAGALTEQLSVAAKRAGGSRVSATLAVRRSPETSLDPPRQSHGVLPDLHEASEGGQFDREAFLRALTVQLANALEFQHGPAAAQAAVAQVGTDVGGRMEEAHRRSEAIVGRLSPEQIAHLYVRLKAGIGGDFYVVEATDERIVLGNRRCPFGEAVKLAPSLCRMTSSVFGGIAARNAGAAAVVLEERIAVGDPECRVVVWLVEPPAEVAAVSHRYEAAPAVGPAVGPQPPG